jgi:hypothetical protein
MPETAEIEAYINELRGRAKESQADARRTLNPLFDREGHGGRPPRDFIPSSFLFVRSCDVDVGSRPVPCPAFWLSPDVRVAPFADLGMATRDLEAGKTYRFTAVVRNRGDLPVPSAKVEFFLCNPTLGWDTRFATRLGVGAGRVQAHGASEVSVDWTVPPTLSGHRCLFVRVFSFSPLDLPVDDFALNPAIDRHVAQLNLNIVAQASKLVVDWVHLRNAAERLEIAPMATRTVRALRLEAVTALTLVAAARWKAVEAQLALEFEPGKGAAIDVTKTETGLELVSQDREAVPLDRQADLTKRVQEALRALEAGRGDAARFRELFKEFRDMNAQTVRSQLTLALPHVGLEKGQAVALNVVKRGLRAREAAAGIAVFVAGDPV